MGSRWARGYWTADEDPLDEEDEEDDPTGLELFELQDTDQ